MYKTNQIPRNELLSWINSFLCTSYAKLEDASNGAVACQILDALFPNVVPMKQLDFSASTEYDCQKNYQVLKKVINKLKLPLNLNIENLSKQGSKESYEFLSSLKKFFDENYNGTPYDAVNRRKGSKGSAKITKVDSKNRPTMCPLKLDDRSPSEELSEGVIHTPKPSGGLKKTFSPFSTPSISTVDMKENAMYKRPSLQPLILHRKVNSCATSPEAEQTISQLRHELEVEKRKNKELQENYEALNNQLSEFNMIRYKREVILLKERAFYYDKLTEIERLIINIKKMRELTPFEKRVLDILYSREGLSDNDSVNSNDIVSVDEERREDYSGNQSFFPS